MRILPLLLLLLTGCGYKPPAGVTATTNTYGVQLNWNNTDGQDALGFVVYREAGVGFEQVASTPTTSYLDKDVAKGQTYSYFVEAVMVDGSQSAASTTVTVIVPQA